MAGRAWLKKPNGNPCEKYKHINNENLNPKWDEIPGLVLGTETLTFNFLRNDTPAGGITIEMAANFIENGRL